MKIALIVEDDDVTRNAVSELLTKVKFTVESSEDGWEGVKRIKKNKYDLIMLDIKMPGIDGEQVMGILKKTNTELPVIVISAYLTKERLIKLKQLGVKGFLTKPIDLKAFYETVNQVCPIDISSI